jgi:hypothetical protein
VSRPELAVVGGHVANFFLLLHHYTHSACYIELYGRNVWISGLLAKRLSLATNWRTACLGPLIFSLSADGSQVAGSPPGDDFFILFYFGY